MKEVQHANLVRLVDVGVSQSGLQEVVVEPSKKVLPWSKEDLSTEITDK